MPPDAKTVAEWIARDSSCAAGEFNQRVLAILPYLIDGVAPCGAAPLVEALRSVQNDNRKFMP